MKCSRWWLGFAAVLLCGFAMFAPAQSAPARGTVVVPESSIPVPCIYKLTKQVKGCLSMGLPQFPRAGTRQSP
jgi:hypothetical protein